MAANRAGEKTLESLMAHAAIEPRDVVFREPWEARAFALALLLAQNGNYEWEEFRRALMTEVASSSGHYYEQLLGALEKLAAAKGLVGKEELRERIAELAAIPSASPLARR